DAQLSRALAGEARESKGRGTASKRTWPHRERRDVEHFLGAARAVMHAGFDLRMPCRGRAGLGGQAGPRANRSQPDDCARSGGGNFYYEQHARDMPGCSLAESSFEYRAGDADAAQSIRATGGFELKRIDGVSHAPASIDLRAPKPSVRPGLPMKELPA